MGLNELASRRRRRSDADSLPLFRACLLLAGGGSILSLLLAIGHGVRLDSLLVISTTIFNIITGFKRMGEGAVLLFTGLAQAVGLFALSLAAMLSVLAVASGMLRLLAHALPGLGSVWNLMAQSLQGLVGLLGLAGPLPRRPARQPAAPVPLAAGRTRRAVVPIRQAG